MAVRMNDEKYRRNYAAHGRREQELANTYRRYLPFLVSYPWLPVAIAGGCGCWVLIGLVVWLLVLWR